MPYSRLIQAGDRTMNIQIIKETNAPPMPKKQSKVAQELLTSLDILKKGEVLRVEPDHGKTIRGLKTGIGRITKSAGISVTTWDDGVAVYVRK